MCSRSDSVKIHSVFHRLSRLLEMQLQSLCSAVRPPTTPPTTSRELCFYQRTQAGRPVSIPDVVDAAFTVPASALFASALIIIRLNQLYGVVCNGVWQASLIVRLASSRRRSAWHHRLDLTRVNCGIMATGVGVACGRSAGVSRHNAHLLPRVTCHCWLVAMETSTSQNSEASASDRIPHSARTADFIWHLL